MISIDHLVRSSRKTIALIVTDEGKLVVRAPHRASRAQIDAFILEKTDWTRGHQAKILARPKPAALGFREGEAFPYLGQAYPLYMRAGQGTRLAWKDGVFWLPPLPPSQAAAAFEAWYRRQARTVFGERLRWQANRLGLKPGTLRISSARTRWGSCSTTGSISLTWRLVMAPMEVIDYVIVHECIHLAVKNHSKAFWQRVAAAYPAYLQAKRWLRENSGLGIELLNLTQNS